MGVGALILTGLQTAWTAWTQREASHFERDTANANAVLSGRAAVDARRRGEIAAHESLKRSAYENARRRVVIADGGVDLQSGTALDLLAAAEGVGDYNARVVSYNAEQEAKGLEGQAMQFRQQARFARRKGRYAIGATVLEGASTMLGQYGRQQGWKGF